MKQFNSIKKLAAVCFIGLAAATSSHAVIVAYPSPGTINATTYTFTAVGSGPVTAYFAGSSAGYGSVIGLSINGAAPLSYGLQDNSTALGTSFAMGSVSPGDIIRFVLAVETTDPLGPSDPIGGSDVSYYLNSHAPLNPGGENHIYSYAYGGGDFGIPAGTYVGVEDISPLAGGDRDYNDHQFVFTGPGLSPVPEGGSTLALLGVVALGVAGLRRWLK